MIAERHLGGVCREKRRFFEVQRAAARRGDAVAGSEMYRRRPTRKPGLLAERSAYRLNSRVISSIVGLIASGSDGAVYIEERICRV